MFFTQRFFIFVPKMYTQCFFLHAHFFIHLISVNISYRMFLEKTVT